MDRDRVVKPVVWGLKNVRREKWEDQARRCEVDGMRWMQYRKMGLKLNSKL